MTSIDNVYQDAFQLAAQQRARDIATKGYSRIQVPPTREGSKRSMGLQEKANSERKLGQNFSQLHDALEEEEKKLYELSFRLQHLSKLAKARLENNKLDAAAASMRKVTAFQQEYVHILRVMEGIKVLEFNLERGLLKSCDVSKCLTSVLNAPWKSTSQKSDEELVRRLEEGKIFPILSGDSTGAVYFISTSPFVKDE